MSQGKIRRLTSAISSVAAACAAALAMVTPTSAQERMTAPRATFVVECYTARPGCEQFVSNMQKRIGEMRAQGRAEEADWLHMSMVRHFMEVKWTETKKNTVVTVGKNDLLDKYFSGSSYTAAWFCGLISSVSYTAIAAGDTMSSHSGWLEAGGTNAPTYTGNRPALTFGAASAGSKATSSASSFTFTGPGTIKGMFATTVTTKDGTTGTLYNAVLFTGGDRAVVNTDVVNVSVTFTA